VREISPHPTCEVTRRSLGEASRTCPPARARTARPSAPLTALRASQGAAKPPGRVRVTPAESPLWKLPTRLVVNVTRDGPAAGGEADVRMEWREDAARAHNTAHWVLQDRFLSFSVKLKVAALPPRLLPCGCLVL